MRQGFTQIDNQIFDLGLKPNELALCIWILSHSTDFNISFHRATKELGIKFETIKSILPKIEEKLYFARQDIAIEITKRLSKFGGLKRSKNGVTHSKIGLQKREVHTPKLDNEHSNNGEKNTPKLDTKNTKEYKKNTKEKFSPNNPFLIVPKNLGGEPKGFVKSLGDIAHKILGST